MPGVSGSAVASASVNYELLTVQFGAAYQVVKVGPDRSAEGLGMAGVGQTAFDVMLGGRWWYQRIDMTLSFFGTVRGEHTQPLGFRQPQSGLCQFGLSSAGSIRSLASACVTG